MELVCFFFPCAKITTCWKGFQGQEQKRRTELVSGAAGCFPGELSRLRTFPSLVFSQILTVAFACKAGGSAPAQITRSDESERCDQARHFCSAHVYMCEYTASCCFFLNQDLTCQLRRTNSGHSPASEREQQKPTRQR